MGESKIIDVDYVEVAEEETTTDTSEIIPEVPEVDQPDAAFVNLSNIVAPEQHIEYGKYNTEDLEKYAEGINELTYIELARMKTELEANHKAMTELKGLIDTIGSMPMEDTMNRRMIQENVLRQGGVDSDLESFMKEYDDIMARITFLQGKTDEALAQYGTDNHGTKFFTEQMLILLNKKIGLLDPDALDYTQKKAMFEKAIEVFSDRTNFDYLSNKIRITLSNKRTMKAFFTAHKENSNSRPAYMSDLLKHFTKDQLEKVTSHLNKIFEIAPSDMDLLLYVFSRICKLEEDSGKDNYVKVFVLNILDLIEEAYDYTEVAELIGKIRAVLREINPHIDYRLETTSEADN